jgi:hypothetical protein
MVAVGLIALIPHVCIIQPRSDGVPSARAALRRPPRPPYVSTPGNYRLVNISEIRMEIDSSILLVFGAVKPTELTPRFSGQMFGLIQKIKSHNG